MSYGGRPFERDRQPRRNALDTLNNLAQLVGSGLALYKGVRDMREHGQDRTRELAGHRTALGEHEQDREIAASQRERANRFADAAETRAAEDQQRQNEQFETGQHELGYDRAGDAANTRDVAVTSRAMQVGKHLGGGAVAALGADPESARLHGMDPRAWVKTGPSAKERDARAIANERLQSAIELQRQRADDAAELERERQSGRTELEAERAKLRPPPRPASSVTPLDRQINDAQQEAGRFKKRPVAAQETVQIAPGIRSRNAEYDPAAAERFVRDSSAAQSAVDQLRSQRGDPVGSPVAGAGGRGAGAGAPTAAPAAKRMADLAPEDRQRAAQDPAFRKWLLDQGYRD